MCIRDSYELGMPQNLEYNIFVENRLAGFQLGGRSEICLCKRLRWGLGSKAAILNNNASARQRIIDETGYISVINSGPSAGRPFDYRSSKNDVAFLGELDTSLIYQTSQNTRFTIGYRAIGIAGVALAANQIPYDFRDASQLERTQTNGNLLLHGGYLGFERSF